MYYSTTYPSPVGRLTLGSDGENLVGLWIEGQKYFKATVQGEGTEEESLPVFRAVRSWLDQYFAGEKPEASSLPLCPAGSGFRLAVWRILRQIPNGEVTTYGKIATQIAAQMGRETMSSQAVGGAVGHNPISIIVPCHRVVGASGSLTGYAGGISKKIQLLKLEGVDLSRLSAPKKGTSPLVWS